MKLANLLPLLLRDRIVLAGDELRFRFRRGKDGAAGIVKSLRLTLDASVARGALTSIEVAAGVPEVAGVPVFVTLTDGAGKNGQQRRELLDIFPSVGAAARARRRVQTALLRKGNPFPTWAKGVLMCCLALGTLTIMSAVSRQIHPLFQSAQAGASASTVQIAPIAASAAIEPEAKRSDIRYIHYGPGRNDPKRIVHVFMDPLCPACGAFNKEIEQLAATVDVYVVPVAIANAKSRDVLSSVVCAEQPAKAWNAMVAMHNALGDQVSVKPCEAGLAVADVNTDMFHGLGYKRTPTIILPNNQRFEEVMKASDILKRLQAS